MDALGKKSCVVDQFVAGQWLSSISFRGTRPETLQKKLRSQAPAQFPQLIGDLGRVIQRLRDLFVQDRPVTLA